MANEVLADIFGALATGNPYAGREQRRMDQQVALAEKLGLGRLGLEGRQVSLQELLAPYQQDLMEAQAATMANNLYWSNRERPISIAQLEADLKMQQQILGETETEADRMESATDAFQSTLDKLGDAVSEGGRGLWEKLMGGRRLAGVPPVRMPAMTLSAAMLGAPPAESPFIGPPAPAAGSVENLFQQEAARAAGIASQPTFLKSLQGAFTKMMTPATQAEAMQYLRDFIKSDPDLAREVLLQAGIRTEADLAKASIEQLRALRMNAIQRRNLQQSFRTGVVR